VGNCGQGAAERTFRPDGRRAITGVHEQNAQVWDCTSGRRVGDLDVGETWITARAWSDDSRWLAVGTFSGELWLAQVEDRVDARKIWALVPREDELGTRFVSALEFDPQSQHIAVGLAIDMEKRRDESPKVEVLVVSVESGAIVRRFDRSPGFASGGVTGLAYSRDGNKLVSVDHGGVFCWELHSQAARWSWFSDTCGDSSPASVLLTSSREHVAVWGHACREGVWDLGSGSLLTGPRGSSTRTWVESESSGLLVAVDGPYLLARDPATFAPRYERWRIDADDELAVVPASYFDGTLGAVQSAHATDSTGKHAPLVELAPRLWDPKRVRAAQAGIAVRAGAER
jgi:WD40 repeat protein